MFLVMCKANWINLIIIFSWLCKLKALNVLIIALPQSNTYLLKIYNLIAFSVTCLIAIKIRVSNHMAQTKSTMNLGTLVALPLEMRCRHAIETLHAVKTMN